MNKRIEKQDVYATKIIACIQEMLDPKSDSEWKIDPKELMEDDNANQFFHALANIAPAMIYCHFTSSEVNNLEFNHIANRLCFQYSKLESL